MPQLDKVAFVSQFFWLCVFYLGFYYVCLKVFLPRLSRILAVRQRKMNVDQGQDQGRDLEHTHVRASRDSMVARACGVSRDMFRHLVTNTTGWVAQNTVVVNQQHYRDINAGYLQSLGTTCVHQSLVLHHAASQVPHSICLKLVLNRIKTARPAPARGGARA